MSLFLQNCSVFLTLLCDVRLMILASFVIIDWLDSYSLVALASRQRLLIEAAPHLSFLILSLRTISSRLAPWQLSSPYPVLHTQMQHSAVDNFSPINFVTYIHVFTKNV